METMMQKGKSNDHRKEMANMETNSQNTNMEEFSDASSSFGKDPFEIKAENLEKE